ncbi:MAG: transglutaminase-like domain-containing protein [Elusimicrobiota bacterium]|nr:transglutaminase-like domain-containing protein [Endomicrobiia bacterium]MDW8166117.1 transglutaminase-like domain-containing protein [Elusimicrobiota bacterium]
MQAIVIKNNNVEKTVRKMIEILRDPIQLSIMRKFSEDILRNTKYHKEKIIDVIRVFNFLKKKIRFLRDIYKIETVKTLKHIVEEIQKKGKLVGDCDDLSMLIAGVLKSIGYPVRFVVTATPGSEKFNHIFVEANIDNNWYPLDLTLPLPFAVKPFRMIKRYEVI